MTAFNPAVLVPASTVAAFNVKGTARSTKQVALDNIKRQIELTSDPKIEGRRTFEIVGDKAKFSIRVNNSALVLGTAKVGNATQDVTEMAVDAKLLKSAFEYFGAEIEAGKFDTQLESLSKKRDARSAKMKATRAAKPKTK